MSIENPYRPPANPVGSSEIGPDLRVAIETTELDFGAILRVTLRLFKQNPFDFGLPTLIYAVLFTAGYIINMRFLMSDFFKWIGTWIARANEGGAMASEELVGNFGRIIGLMTLFSLFFILMQAFYNLYMTVRAGDRVMRPASTPGVSLTQTLRRFIPFLFVSFLAFFPVMFGMIFCFIPGFLLMVYFSMLTPLVGIERRGPSALARCFSLVRNRFGKTFLVYFLVVAVFYGASLIVTIPLNMAMSSTFGRMNPESFMVPQDMMLQMFDNPLFITGMALSTILTTLLYAFLAVVATVMYLNYSREERIPESSG